jgi:hypothetical protein
MKIESKLSRLDRSTLSETVTKAQLDEVDRRYKETLKDIDELDCSRGSSDSEQKLPESSFTKTHTKITKEVENNFKKKKND